jgi:RNA polymerase sigma-70 factor (ECF subfamily)
MPETTVRVQDCLRRLRQDDPQALNDLIGTASERLLALARRMFRDYPRLHPHVETMDVFQQAAVRLARALRALENKPDTARAFYGLAALQIRRELRDMIDHFFGRGEQGRAPPGPLPDGTDFSEAERSWGTLWGTFHEAVDRLGPEEREVVELLWYQDLTQEEAAAVLEVDRSTVKRRWRSARLRLAAALQGLLPGLEDLART